MTSKTITGTLMNLRKQNSKFREIVQTQVNLHCQFHFTSAFLKVFHMTFRIRFRHLALIEMIPFEMIFKTAAQKFTIR